MVKAWECNRETIGEVFRRAQRAAEEHQRAHAESLRQEACAGDVDSQLVTIIVDRPDRTSLLIAFNTDTGQAGMISCVTPRRRFSRRSPYDWSGQFRRVSADEAAKMLVSGKRRLLRAFKRENAVSYPDWLFEPTGERADDWLKTARLYRHEAYIGRIAGAREEISYRIHDGLRFLQVIVIVAAISVIHPRLELR